MSLSFFGKNSIERSDILFHSKRLYYSALKNEPRYLDLWYTKPLYGKVDPNFRIVTPFKDNMKVLIDGAAEGTSSALNFVADAFNAMNIYLEELALRKKIQAGSFFYPLKVENGWRHVSGMYGPHTKRIYNSFVSSYLLANGEKLNRQITSFHDFLPIFIDYLNASSSRIPLTKTGFVSKLDCPYSTSGLVIEIARENDFSDDPKKYSKYFSDPQFSMFLEIANQFGFYVDMNVPWRLIANLDSPAWKTNTVLIEIIDNYFEEGYDIQKVFDDFYYKPYLTDVQSLKFFAMGFYNSFITERPAFHKPVYCGGSSYQRGTIRGKKVYRKKITMEDMERFYDDLYWLKFYFLLRLMEDNIGISKHQTKHAIKEIEQQYGTKGYDSALEYIAERLSSFLQEELVLKLKQDPNVPSPTIPIAILPKYEVKKSVKFVDIGGFL